MNRLVARPTSPILPIFSRFAPRCCDVKRVYFFVYLDRSGRRGSLDYPAEHDIRMAVVGRRACGCCGNLTVERGTVPDRSARESSQKLLCLKATTALIGASSRHWANVVLPTHIHPTFWSTESGPLSTSQARASRGARWETVSSVTEGKFSESTPPSRLKISRAPSQAFLPIPTPLRSANIASRRTIAQGHDAPHTRWLTRC